MPRLVDHTERRSEISAATWRVIERGGLAAVTLRSVAAEAQVSLGVLAHYFHSKEDVLLDADRMAFDRALDRVITKTAGQRGLTALESAILEALPLDGDRRLEAQIDVAFVGMSLTHPDLARARRASSEALRALVRMTLRDARKLRELRPGLNDELIADECLALIDGASILGLLAADDPGISERLTAMAHAFVRRLKK